MQIYVCQTAPKTGALEHNYNEICRVYERATERQADVCLLPEMALSGYLVEDLLLYPAFIEDIESYNDRLVVQTKATCLLLPTVVHEDGRLFNSVIAAQNGQIIGRTDKVQLPNYGVFDEKRYFTPGKSRVIKINDKLVGVPICEDLWGPDVALDLRRQGAEILLAPNASPYDYAKFDQRSSVLKARHEETGLPIIYCNQAMVQDGIVFDGKSMTYDGSLQTIGASFEASEQLVFLSNNRFKAQKTYHFHEQNQDIIDAMVFALRSYVLDNGFKKVVLGLSGGIDSAIVAYLAVQALGKDSVYAYMLPSRYNSQDSMKDAQKLVQNLGISSRVIAIDEICEQFIRALRGDKVMEGSLTHQNLQSRVRGSILMAQSNLHGALLLTTGNKSEYAVGYATIYGDMNGAFNPIKDLYKTQIYEIAEFINRTDEIIPQRILSKEPSAELSHGQKDSDSLPPYDLLDRILYDHIEQHMSMRELRQKYDVAIVEKVLSLVKNSEFKRRQSAPGVKISANSFDKERRVPITQFYK